MKTPVLVACAVVLLSGAVPAQESAGEKAADAWDTTKHTAKKVGRTLKHETKKAANAVVEAVTPDPDAHRVDVKVTADRIDMPKSIPAGKTAFVVTNTGNEKLAFEVERTGQEQNFATSLAPQQTKVLQVRLERGQYHAGCFIKGHETQRQEINLRVR
jgi:iron uptake system EfeUOB component EfeO/EfeM